MTRRYRGGPDVDWGFLGVLLFVAFAGFLAWLFLTLTHASVPSCPPGQAYDVKIMVCD